MPWLISHDRKEIESSTTGACVNHSVFLPLLSCLDTVSKQKTGYFTIHRYTIAVKKQPVPAGG